MTELGAEPVQECGDGLKGGEAGARGRGVGGEGEA